MSNIIRTPAQSLEGTLLPCGWKVSQYIPKEDGQSGGNFSVGYKATKDDKEAFLKALDYKKLMNSRGIPKPSEALAHMASSFEFEKNILEQCNNGGMSKIIRSFSSDTLNIDSFLVPYIIFEMAQSDIRKFSLNQAGFDLAWTLRTMHQVATGIKQLHSAGISHQDIKPSNILLVDQEHRKIGDFGTCVTKDCTLPHAEMHIAGDATYAPPEALYGYIDPEWSYRRHGNDAYQLGSLMVFMIVGIPSSTLLLQNLNEQFHPARWSRSYYDVLPYIDEAFIQCIEVIKNHLPENSLKKDIIALIKELCEPSIFIRGDPVLRRRNMNPFNMERYISRFDRLAKCIEFNLYKKSV